MAWVLTKTNGCIGILETLQEHRGRGLATLLVEEITKQFLAEGLVPLAFVSEGNGPSKRLFERLGWTLAEDTTFLTSTEGH